MTKVLIADDEEHICELIKLLIDWDGLGLTLVATVHSGKEALEKYKELGPDIIISDIRMSGISGLDLIKEVKKLNSDVNFLIISGYRYFEYAYEALRNGADDYIVKPIKEEDINNALKKILNRRNRKLNIENENYTFKCEKVIVDLMQYPQNISTCTNVQMFNERYNLAFPDEPVSVFVIKIDIQGEGDLTEQLKVISAYALSILMKKMNRNDSYIVAASYNDMIPVITTGKVINSEDGTKLLNHIITEIQQFADEMVSVRACVGVGGEGRIKDLVRLTQDALDAVWEKIFNFSQKLFQKPQNEDQQELYSDAARRELKGDILNMNYNGVLEIYSLIEVRIMDGRKNLSGKHIYCTLDTVLKDIQDSLSEMKTEKDMVTNIEESRWKLRMYREFCQMIQFVRVTIQNVIDRLKQYEESIIKKPVLVAIQYINDHYSEELSLETISNIVGLNSVYFSTMFKKETKRSFVEFLTGIRIEKAAELLVNSSYNISEIAWKVGYQDEKYFMRVFKKTMGLTCAKYRKLYGRKI